MLIPRHITAHPWELSLTGPRQAGKKTLLKDF